MDPGQMAELRRWAATLSERGDVSPEEARAAARAILLLAEEVESLRRELDTSRAGAWKPPEELEGDEEPDDRPPDEGPPPSGGLRSRLRRTFAPGSPGGERSAEARRLELRLPSRRVAGRLALALGILGALAYASLALGARLAAPHIEAQGPAQGARVGAGSLGRLAFAVRAGRSEVARVRWSLDGVDVTSRARVAGDESIFVGDRLGDGRHRLTASLSGGFPGARSGYTWRFAVDTTPPAIRIPAEVAVHPQQAIVLSGRVEPGARLTAGGRPVAVRQGRFRLRLASRPERPVVLRATDSLGNARTRRVSVVLVPRRPPEPVRAVHVTIDAWATPTLRDRVLRMLDEGRINAVELDLKDESGAIGFDAPITLAREVGTVRDAYDLREAIELLHHRGARVIGRIVAFRDPVHAAAAWKAGRRGEVVQTPAGEPYSGYGGFTSLASPAVRRYNVDVAVAAARAGIDEVLYDYIRRPDGPRSGMVFPGLDGTPGAAVVRFLAEARARLRPYGTFLGASVFGVAATRPHEVAQDIPRMAAQVDYIAPMLYPSHWGPGEYGVGNPNAEPYAIVLASLRDFQAAVEGTGARVVPWLQDFSLGVPYGAAEVRAQIAAARDAGIDEWLLWDPAVTYTAKALAPGGRMAVLQPNELGVVPVLMYHQILADGGGGFDITPEEFRADLARLWAGGYVPVTARDLVEGRLDVPKGRSPVVLTFDDSDNNQVRFLPDGRLDPSSAVGILMDFAATHPGFTPTATFFVLRDPFTGAGRPSDSILRWLVDHGFELANHSKDHTPLDGLGVKAVQRQLVLGKEVITGAVPGYRVTTLALPLGAEPSPRALAVRGRWGGRSYRHAGVFLVGAEPAPSPFRKDFEPTAIPRIRTLPEHGKRDFGSTYWLGVLERNPGLRYVSDGDPKTVSFPAARADELAPAYRSLAKPS